jgi:hypothetical protein
LILKDKKPKLKTVVLKNKTLTIKVDNLEKLDSQTKKELETTAKFFPQVDNVKIQNN